MPPSSPLLSNLTSHCCVAQHSITLLETILTLLSFHRAEFLPLAMYVTQQMQRGASYWSVVLFPSRLSWYIAKMADREVRDVAAATQDSTGSQEAASCGGTLFYLQPGGSLPTPVSESSCVSLKQAVGAVAGKDLEKPIQETSPPPIGKKAGGSATGQGLEDHLQHAEPLQSQESGLRASPPSSFPAQGVSSATSSSWSGSLPVSRILHNVAQQLQCMTQRVALPQGKTKAAAVAPDRLQLETIRVQVQPEQTKENERPAPSFAPVQCRNETSPQPAEKNSRGLGLNVINPQVIRIQPITGSGSQQFLLYNSSEPTVQLLLQRPLHPLGQVSLDKTTTPRILNGQKANSVTIAAADSPKVTLVSACSANSITNQEKQQKKQKLKKSLKVKTRSGRISRPPKYKAKDYKFIKTEDLADCHQSDSDDYSELSVEDDEEEGKGEEAPSLFGSLNYDLRPKLFKCQTCEKSYIGKGGLARHYKLNPDHGQQESSQSSSINRPHGMALLEDIGKVSGESVYQNSSPPPPVTLINENALAVVVGKNLPSKSGQQSGTCVEDRMFAEQNAHLLHVGPRRPRRCGRPKMAERSRYSGRFNRPGQFPSKSLNNMSAEHQSVFRRKARLKELIQQCANEDFMELAGPRFTTLVTVFEFLLMKVGKNYAAKAVFPDVYKEFEELHAMVKEMCQDYFNDPELSKVVEIKNHKVAESLGITESLLRLQKIQADSTPECIKSTHEYLLSEILGQKRVVESSDEILPSAKKTRRESLLENVNINYSRPSGVKEINSINEGFTPEENCVANGFLGNRVLEKEQYKSLELEAGNDCINPDLICQPMKVESENSQPSRTSGLDRSDNLPLWGEMLPTVSTEISQEKIEQVNSGWNAASRRHESEVCNSVVSEVGSLNPDLSVLKENDNEKCQAQEEATEDSCVNTCSGLPQGSDQSEKAVPMNAMLVAHPFGSPVESYSYTSSCSENS